MTPQIKFIQPTIRAVLALLQKSSPIGNGKGGPRVPGDRSLSSKPIAVREPQTKLAPTQTGSSY